MFIVLYGANNIGKSTQAKLLLAKFKQAGLKAEYIKNPLYDLAPTGEILNNYLREGNIENLTAREFQILTALNRTQFDDKLKNKLKNKINIIAEDYIGTSLAWGMAAGVSESFLAKTNSHLIKPDIAILLSGDRFTQAMEAGHKHEENEELIKKVQKIYLNLAKKNNWQIINANQDKQKISQEIWDKIKPFL